MKIRIDAQLSPGLARWLSEHHAVEAFSVRRLGLHDATDDAIPVHKGCSPNPSGRPTTPPHPETRGRSPESSDGNRAIAAPFFCSARRSS